MEDCDEDGGEGFDPPTRSFLRRRLDEQSWEVKQSNGQKMNNLLKAIQSNGDTQTRSLELLVNKAFEDGHVGQPRQLPFKNVLLQAEIGSARLQPIDLEKRRGSSSRADGHDQGMKTTSVNDREKISKSPSRGTIYKNPTVSHALVESEDPQYASVDAVEIVIDKPYVCKELAQINSKDAKTRSASKETIKTSKVYTFDITKADAIFDQLLLARIIKLWPGHNIPKAEELKGKTYCKYYNSSKHTTHNCVVFRDAIQSWIDKGKLKFPEKQMAIDVNPFPLMTIGMVDVYLPKNKGKGKAEFVPSQKRHRQQIDCMAQRQKAQANSTTRWQPKEAAGSGDDQPTPTIMAELLQEKKAVGRDFETIIKESEKRIKLILRPREMKTRLEHFRQEAESKLPLLPSQQPLIKVQRNLHPLFLSESLEYMREFHKKHSANDLYGLPKACQEALDVALTYPDAEQIIQKTTDPAIKAKFQHIREARALGFEVDPYTDIDTAELLFSLEDLQHLRYHFETDTTFVNLEDDNQDPMGPLILEHIEIIMVYVLLVDFQPTLHQSNFLDGDMVAEEATQLDFIVTEEDGEISKDDKLKATLAELFPRSPSVNLQHLKSLYVTAHIEGYPISKVFVDYEAIVNIMPISIMKTLRHSNNELIPSEITMSSFIGDKSQTKGVLLLEVSVAGRNHMTAFFIIDSKTEYNALLARDWIHETSCIPSSLYQDFIFWKGKSVVVHPADNQPFETNMIQTCYYDDYVSYITLQGFNEDGRQTRISVQKAIEVGAETVH
ncbi:uncharacterized protein [Pyrus communis]|uniref:uncharacterized protein n=1 Tax=Pyrus communis TaxID=23211 RepID=UPI0035BED88B